MNGLSMVRVTADALPFVLSSVSKAMAEVHLDPEVPRRAISRLLRDPSSRAMLCTPDAHPDCYIGWALGHDGGLVYLYVRKTMRKLGIGSALLTEVTDTTPVKCAFWSRSFSRMARKGLPLLFDLDYQAQVMKFAR